MHWYTCKSLLDTLGRAAEQFAVFLEQAKVSSQGQSTSHVVWFPDPSCMGRARGGRKARVW